MKINYNFLKVSVLSCLLLCSAAVFGQVSLGKRTPGGQTYDSLPFTRPQGYLHLQGKQQYVAENGQTDSTTIRNVGMIVPKVDSVIHVFTPTGGEPVEGTIVFTVPDSIEDKTDNNVPGGIRVKTEEGWSGILSEMSALDNIFDFDIYGGLNVRVKKVSAGSNFSLIIGDEDESVYASGSNESGKTGIGSTDGYTTTFRLILAQRTRDISAGYKHAISVNYDGTLWGWGDGAYGKTANSNQLTNTAVDYVFPMRIDVKTFPQFEVPNDTIIRVEAGHESSLVLSNTGKVWAFGRGSRGLVNLSTSVVGLSPFKINFGTEIIKDIALSSASAAAVTNDGKVYTWGNQQFGRLGNNPINPSTSTVVLALQELAFPDNTRIKQVAMGSSHGLAVSEDGKKLFGWGARAGWGAGGAAAVIPEDVTNMLQSQGFNANTDSIVYIAATRFFTDPTTGASGAILGSGTLGGSIVITQKNSASEGTGPSIVYAAGNHNGTAGTTQAQVTSQAAYTDRYGLGFFIGSNSATIDSPTFFSPSPTGGVRGVTTNGFYPIYDKAFFEGTKFDQVSIGVHHSLMKQTLLEEDDGSGTLTRSGSYGFGMGNTQYGQLGAVNTGATTLPIPVFIKR
ncbi:MAG: hypothetical protein LBU22_08925 [Dysgonamonadaceae bacterium]|jgi:alpha-tubulin suppressor-like RCC1 family protein|nr:hypothetical protein [Dysgonamonadaceae bacterium]